MLKKRLVWLVIAVSVVTFGMVSNTFAAGEPEGEPLKIGVLGVMSGRAASWGLVCKYAAEANAKMLNAQGGVVIDGVRHKIEIVSVDTRQDPKVALAGAKRLVEDEGIRYIIGPNVDNTGIGIAPFMESAGAMYIPYGQSREVIAPPHHNAILGMIVSFQSGPIMYKYMKENLDVKTIAFVARNQADPLNQRKVGIEAAEKLGLQVNSWEETYDPGTIDFYPVMTNVVIENPDQIVLSGVSPGDAPLLIKAARELGYEGYISAETAHDINILNDIAGEYANDFIFVGGASTPEIASDYMNQFIEVYTEVAGEWHDEAGTKVYALPMIMATLQHAGAAAINDVELFKKAIPEVAITNPYLKQEQVLKYVGAEYFGQPHQIGIPLVVNIVKDGKLEVLFIGSVD